MARNIPITERPWLRRVLRLHLRHWGSYFDPPLDHNGKPVQGKGFLIDDLTDHAIKFIEKHLAPAILCYLPVNHAPLTDASARAFYEGFASADLKLRARNPAQEDVAFTAPRWPCAKTLTGTLAASWIASTS